MKHLTRRERRTERQRHYLMKREKLWAPRNLQASSQSRAFSKADRETLLPGWLRHLDYKTPGESGALRVPSKTRIQNPANPLDRAGSTYVVGVGELQLTRHIIHYQWRRLITEQMAKSTTT